VIDGADWGLHERQKRAKSGFLAASSVPRRPRIEHLFLRDNVQHFSSLFDETGLGGNHECTAQHRQGAFGIAEALVPASLLHKSRNMNRFLLSFVRDLLEAEEPRQTGQYWNEQRAGKSATTIGGIETSEETKASEELPKAMKNSSEKSRPANEPLGVKKTKPKAAPIKKRRSSKPKTKRSSQETKSSKSKRSPVIARKPAMRATPLPWFPWFFYPYPVLYPKPANLGTPPWQNYTSCYPIYGMYNNQWSKGRDRPPHPEGCSERQKPNCERSKKVDKGNHPSVK